ncbi:glycosyl hydrolase family 16 [Coprinopsis cinerea AmutBmut pab1-1]|nr:glycosyl hydrolase family 16 [Coprinopsis cinerea AmutBmut pab1-1]
MVTRHWLHWLLAFVTSALLATRAFGAAARPPHHHHEHGHQTDGYRLTERHVGNDFLKNFEFEAISDPTHGRVNYVNETIARQEGLAYATGDTFVLRADSTTVLDPKGPGRNSVRLVSRRYYKTSVMVFDIRHMPQGCGTWPAVWTVGDNWPNQGEIDILEGVNDQSPNQVTLHTSAGCEMPPERMQTGTPAFNNCDAAVNFNAGCGVKIQDSRSYGPAFNAMGGGWYAVEITPKYIKSWFWPRDSSTVPPEVVRQRHGVVQPARWGIPDAYFPATDLCDLRSKFGPQRIVINLTFCGDWAGSVYGASGCPSTCVDFVNNNPEAFIDAYFDFASLRVYE